MILFLLFQFSKNIISDIFLLAENICLNEEKIEFYQAFEIKIIVSINDTFNILSYLLFIIFMRSCFSYIYFGF